MFRDDLKKAMKENHISCVELGKYLGVSDSAVDAWRSGRNLPRTRELNMICDLFDLKLEHYVKEIHNKRNRRNLDFDTNKLKAVMKRTNTSQRELAAGIGYSQRAIQNWCNGDKPNKTSTEALSKYFGVNPEWWSKNVVEPFTPKEQADPKVIEKERKWKNPYTKTVPAPVISTPVVEVKDLTEEEIEDVKKMIKSEPIVLPPKEPFRCDMEIKKLKEKMDLIDFDYQLQVDALSDRCDKLEEELSETSKALNDLRKLIVDHLLTKDEEPEEKKGFWARLFE